jgi:hypothetical protein
VQVGKQRAGLWKCRKDFFNLFAKPNLRWLLSAPARFHPNVANDPRLPVHVLDLQWAKSD